MVVEGGWEGNMAVEGECEVNFRREGEAVGARMDTLDIEVGEAEEEAGEGEAGEGEAGGGEEAEEHLTAGERDSAMADYRQGNGDEAKKSRKDLAGGDMGGAGEEDTESEKKKKTLDIRQGNKNHDTEHFGAFFMYCTVQNSAHFFFLP